MERQSGGSKPGGNRLILGGFLAFLFLVGAENQCAMFGQLDAYRNDAYVQRLREELRAEYLAFRHHRPGALDVRGENTGIRLSQIGAGLAPALPPGLRLLDGTPGEGTLAGMGHPFLGGRAEETLWILVPGPVGAGLDIKAIPKRTAHELE